MKNRVHNRQLPDTPERALIKEAGERGKELLSGLGMNDEVILFFGLASIIVELRAEVQNEQET